MPRTSMATARPPRKFGEHQPCENRMRRGSMEERAQKAGPGRRHPGAGTLRLCVPITMAAAAKSWGGRELEWLGGGCRPESPAWGALNRTRPSTWGQVRMGPTKAETACGPQSWLMPGSLTNTFALQNPCNGRGWMTWLRWPVLKHFQLAQVAGFIMRDAYNLINLSETVD